MHDPAGGTGDDRQYSGVVAMTKGKFYLLIQAAVCLALVLLLSLAAVGILREGTARKAEHPMESIYTPENVAEKLAPIVPLFFAGVGLLIVGLVLGVKDENADKPVTDLELARDLVVARVAQPSDAMRRERAAQKRLMWIGWGAFALCMLPIAIHISNPAHFPETDPEGMFHGLLRVFLPWTAAGLGALAVTAALREKSILRETEAAQARRKEERARGIAPEPKAAGRPGKTGILQAVIVVVAAILIIAGVFNGSARDVLYKAITICTECVGLG